MLKRITLIFGIVFIVVGIIGFIPGITTRDGYLLGLFEVNWVHNLVHLVTGIIALLVCGKDEYAKLFFQVFGIIYAAVTVLGFVFAGNLLIMHVNMWDNFLHLVIAVFALYMGYGFKEPKIAKSGTKSHNE